MSIDAPQPCRLELALAGGVRLRVFDGGRTEVERPGRAPDAFAWAPGASGPKSILGAVSRARDAALLAGLRHDTMAWISAHRPGHLLLALGERLTHSEQLALHALTEGFLVVFENGLVCVGADGHERWRLGRVAVDWAFVGERDGAVWLSDHDGNLLGFDTRSGDEQS